MYKNKLCTKRHPNCNRCQADDLVGELGYPWYSGSMLDCSSRARAIDPKFISPGCVWSSLALQLRESWPKTPFLHSKLVNALDTLVEGSGVRFPAVIIRGSLIARQASNPTLPVCVLIECN